MKCGLPLSFYALRNVKCVVAACLITQSASSCVLPAAHVLCLRILVQATTPKVPENEEEAVSALELIFTKVAPTESSMATVDAETAEVSPRLNHGELSSFPATLRGLVRVDEVHILLCACVRCVPDGGGEKRANT